MFSIAPRRDVISSVTPENMVPNELQFSRYWTVRFQCVNRLLSRLSIRYPDARTNGTKTARDRSMA